MCRLNLWDFRMDYNYYKWGGGKAQIISKMIMHSHFPFFHKYLKIIQRIITTAFHRGCICRWHVFFHASHYPGDLRRSEYVKTAVGRSTLH